LTALVDLRDVGKAYVRGRREVVALRDVTLQIEEGE
jgi:ABC-type lipoprotein export system ATPase subunit